MVLKGGPGIYITDLDTSTAEYAASMIRQKKRRNMTITRLDTFSGVLSHPITNANYL